MNEEETWLTFDESLQDRGSNSMRKKYQQYPNNRFLKITKQIQEVSLTFYHNWEQSKPEAKTS